ncbi:MAG: cytochrome P450, partial [Myxococcales bacterium]|nr:cytochrome P450 [Myxococcales bacterium]
VGVVEETLRFEPPALSCSRTTVEPITLGGVAIPAGSHLLVCIGAANRDPRRFPDPDRFDVERPVERGAETLSFGGGRHFCLGAALARLEAQLAVRALLEHAPDIALHEPIAWRKDSPTVRAPAHLVVSRAGRC